MSVSLIETNHAVEVVPTLAPRTTPRLDWNVRIPESTREMASATTALLDWTIAVASAPSNTPRTGLRVRRPSQFLRVSPPTAWISRVKACSPYRNRTIADITARTKLILDVAALLMTRPCAGEVCVPSRAHSCSRPFRMFSSSARRSLLTPGYSSFIFARL
jgi:hypothetical protein